MAGVPGASLPQGCMLSPPHIDSEVWATCSGPLLRVPAPLSLAAYFPQGHAEHVSSLEIAREAAEATEHPWQMLCQVLEVTAQADVLTESQSLRLKLQPIRDEEDPRVVSIWHQAQPELTSDSEWPPRTWGHPEAVWKVLSASDASLQGGLTLPERAATTCFPPLDMDESLPFQSISAKDLFSRTFTFKHVYRGRPRRNKLTTNWNAFMQEKQLQSQDRIVFIRGQGGGVKVGLRRDRAALRGLTQLGTEEEQRNTAAWILQQSAVCQTQGLPFEVELQIRDGACPFVIPLDQLCSSLKQLGEVRPGRRFRMPKESPDFRVELVSGAVLAGRNLEQGVRTGQSPAISFSTLPPLWRLVQVEWPDQEPGREVPARPGAVSPWEIMLLEARRGQGRSSAMPQLSQKGTAEGRENRSVLGRRRRGGDSLSQGNLALFEEHGQPALEPLAQRSHDFLGRALVRRSPETMHRVASYSHSQSYSQSPVSPISCPARVGDWDAGEGSVHGGQGEGVLAQMENSASKPWRQRQQSLDEHQRHASTDHGGRNVPGESERADAPFVRAPRSDSLSQRGAGGSETGPWQGVSANGQYRPGHTFPPEPPAEHYQQHLESRGVPTQGPGLLSFTPEPHRAPEQPTFQARCGSPHAWSNPQGSPRSAALFFIPLPHHEGGPGEGFDCRTVETGVQESLVAQGDHDKPNGDQEKVQSGEQQGSSWHYHGPKLELVALSDSKRDTGISGSEQEHRHLNATGEFLPYLAPAAEDGFEGSIQQPRDRAGKQVQGDQGHQFRTSKGREDNSTEEEEGQEKRKEAETIPQRLKLFGSFVG